MAHTDETRPRLTLHKGLRGRIEDIERQMDRLEAERQKLARMQNALAAVETQLRRMAALAGEAAELPAADRARRARLSHEFERCRRRIDAIAAACGPDGQNLLADDLAAVRGSIASLDALLREEFERG